MKLIDRNLLRETFVPFLIGQAVVVMLLTGSVLYNNASILISNQVPFHIVFRIVLYFIPFLIQMTMPVSVAVGTSLAVSRLARDSELTVKRASGVSLRRIFLPFWILGLVISVADFYFGEIVVPSSIRKLEAVINEIPSSIPALRPQPDQWIVSTDKSYVIYVRHMNPRPGYVELQGVMFASGPKAIYSGDSAPVVAYAETGRFKDGLWTLEKSDVYTFTTDGDKVTQMRGKDFKYYAPVDPQVFQSGLVLQFPLFQMGQSSKETFWTLGAKMQTNKKQGINDIETILDYHFRLSIPFSCLVMALCCPALSFRFARGGGFVGTLLSICLVFVYWNTMLLARILGSPLPNGKPPLLPPEIAPWAQNILFILLAIYVQRRSERGR